MEFAAGMLFVIGLLGAISIIGLFGFWNYLLFIFGIILFVEICDWLPDLLEKLRISLRGEKNEPF